jgi:hypothetical protein
MADFSSNALSSSPVDAYSSFFEPDVVLPSQFFDLHDQGVSGGERKLMAALLSDGIEAYIAQQTTVQLSRRRNKIDASEWVDTIDHSYVFSFDNVCECLGINPEYLRIGLNRYVETIRVQRKSGIGPKTVWKKIRRPRKK